MPKSSTIHRCALAIALCLVAPASTSAAATRQALLEPAQWLPATTVFALGTSSIETIYKQLSLDKLVGWLGPRTQAKLRRFVKKTGVDLLSRRGLTKLGVDIKRGAIYAVAGLEPRVTLAMVIPINSPRRFLRGVCELKSIKPAILREGPVPIYKLSSRELLVLRKRWAILLATRYNGVAAAQRLAESLTADRLPSTLANQGGLAAALAALGSPSKDGFLWVDFEGVARVLGRRERASIVRLQQQQRTSPQDWRGRYAQRKQRELEAFELIAAPFRKFVIGADWFGQGIKGSARLTLRPKTYLQRLIKQPIRIALPHLIWPAPMAGASVHIDPKELLRLILALVQTGSPQDVKETLTTLEKSLGKTLDQFVGSLLDGRVEVYLGARLPLPKRIESPLDVLEIHISLGLKDPQLFRQLLNLATSLGGKLLTPRRTERYVAYGLKVDANSTLELAQIGKRLVFSSSTALLDRLASGSRTSFLDRWLPSEANAKLKRPASISGLLNLGQIVSLVMLGVSRTSSYYVSPQTTHTAKEDQLRAELRELGVAKHKALNGFVNVLEKSGGVLAFQLSLHSGALAGDGVWAMRSSLASWAERLTRAAGRFAEQLNRISERSREVYRQLSELRRTSTK